MGMKRQDVAVKQMPIRVHRILRTICAQEGLNTSDVVEAATFALLSELEKGRTVRELMKKMREYEFGVTMRVSAQA